MFWPSTRALREPRRSSSTTPDGSCRSPKSSCGRRTRRAAPSSRIPRRCSTPSSSAGRQALSGAGVPVAAVALANQGETVLAWDRSSGRPLTPAVVWQDRRAESICASLSGSADTVAQRTGLVLDPYFSAPKMAWIRANQTREGVVTTTDTWLVNRLCGAFVTDASTASRSLVTSLDSVAWDDELLALFGLAGEALPEIVGSDEIVGSTDVFGVPIAGGRADRRPTGRAAGRELPGTGFRQVHLRHRCVPARPVGRQPGEVHRGPDHIGGVAAARAHVLLRRRSGLYGGFGRAVGHRSGAGACRRSTRHCRSRFQRRRAVRACPRRAGGAVVGFCGHRVVQRDDAVQRARAPCPGAARGHRRSGGRAGRSRRHRSGSAADEAAGGRWPHPLRRARCRPRRTSPASPSTSTHRCMPPRLAPRHARGMAIDPGLGASEAVGGWTPQHTYEPTWSADRAAEYLARWRHAAESVLAQKETTTP